MYEIVKKELLADKIFEMVVKAPRVAGSCLPGQFVIVRTDEESERIPLTICDYDRNEGTITIVVQMIGASTEKMEELNEGDSFHDFVGPLGNPSDLCVEENLEETKKKKIVFIAGGLGTAPVYCQVKWLHEHDVPVTVIMGSRTKDLLFYVDKMNAVSDNHVTTDDGTYGFHGMGTDCLKSLVNEGREFDHCVAIGPMIMMKFVCLLTKELGIHTVVSMNPVMVDGTGMCGACRLIVDGKVKFACVDGPEFDGHLVDFDLAMKRMKQYKTEEGRKKLEFEEGETHHGGCGLCGGDK
jgi:ferredoxin--NADP+ reductase